MKEQAYDISQAIEAMRPFYKESFFTIESYESVFLEGFEDEYARKAALAFSRVKEDYSLSLNGWARSTGVLKWADGDRRQQASACVP